MTNLILILFIPLILITNHILKKNKILLNYTGQSHQKYTHDDYIPLSGGSFIFLFFILNFNYFNIYFLIFLCAFYIFGLIVDLNLIKSPSLRFIIQIFFLIIFISNFDLSIKDLRIMEINNLLENYYINMFFVIFCLLVFINGSNFIDGNNGLAIGYFLIIFLVFLYLYFKMDFNYDINLLFKFIFLLIILLFFNLFNKIYLGDNGIYILSLFAGFLVINLSSNYPEISPYFMANLLWYPAFEILFSLIRKISSKFSPMDPDTLHLHQLLFYFFKKKLNMSKIANNSLTGISINIYNSVVIFFALLNIYNTKLQILFLSISITTYIISYFFLNNFKKLFVNEKLKH